MGDVNKVRVLPVRVAAADLRPSPADRRDSPEGDERAGSCMCTEAFYKQSATKLA